MRRPLICLALLLLGRSASADLGPDVAIQVLLPQGIIPCINEVFPASIQLVASSNVTLSTPSLSTGRTPTGQLAWQISGTPLPNNVLLLPAQPQTFPLHLLCNDPTQPIEIRYEVGARSVVQRFYLTPETLDVAVTATVMAPDSDQTPPPAAERNYALPAPHEPSLEGITDLRAEGAQKRGRNIRVYGSFVYYRNSHDNEYQYVGDGLQMGADGVTAYVYDSDVDADDLLDSVVLGPSGAYDMTFWYDQGEDPDIYVKFVSANGKVELSKPGQNTNYSWSTVTKEDFTGSTINFGKRWPGNDEHYAGLNALATATRAWRWLNDLGYGGIDRVEISWPDSDWPHYKPIFETIYLPDFAQWNEGTVVHEYGHHWQQEYTPTDGTDYCNPGNRCDDPDEDCRHCAWCQETEGDAVQEGFPNWLSGACTSSFPSYYGFSALLTRNYESVNMCTWDDLNQFDPAHLVEGNVSCFLQDVSDWDNDDDPNGFGSGDDLSLGPIAVLQAQDFSNAITPHGLIEAFRSLHPSLQGEIWRTAKNNRYELFDTVPPSALTGLISTSHLTVGQDPDGTVDLVWNACTDDYSGVGGYRILVSTSPSGLNPTQHLSPTNSWTSPDLSPGTYYFFVSAYDGDLNYGASASFGGVTIRDWIPSDLESYAGSWTYPIIPNNTGDHTVGTAVLPSILTGNSVDTYWSVRFRNTGELTTTPSTLKMYLYVDGLLWGIHNIVNLPPLAALAYLNIDPFPIPGGRHAVGMWLDSTELMPEPDELDNRYARQFIWSPYPLSGSGWVTRDDPPAAWGGFTPGIFAAPNCDGFSYGLGSATFMGAVIEAVDPDADYDLNLHEPYSSSTSGFGWFDRVANSFRPAGHLDGVFTNNALTTTTTFNPAVVDYGGATGDFRIRRLSSTNLPIGGTQQVLIPAVDHITLRHFSLSGGSGPNWATLTVQSDPANGPLHVNLIAADVVHTGLDDGAYQLLTDENGSIKLNFQYAASLHGLVLWQDPIDLAKQAVDFNVAVRVDYMRPDLVPLETAGWYAPLVPTHGAPGTPAATPAPASLSGNANTTYLNVQFRNQGFLDANTFDSMNFLDGVPVLGEQIFGVGGFSNWIKNFVTPITVRGGRHTLSMFPDSDTGVAEDEEGNNRMGNQWVWSPIGLADGALLHRAAPPDPYGGYAEVVGWKSQLFWPNCDGMRTSFPIPSGNNGHWVAVAAMPGANSDVDLRLHEKGNGTTNGFRTPRAVSAFGVGQSDYVLMNFRETSPREFEVGVTAVEGSEPFDLDQTRSVFLGTSPSGFYGPYLMHLDELIDLHEVELDAGFISIAVEQSDLASADIDWGLSLHMLNLPYQSKSSGPSVLAEAWSQDAGWRESFVVDVPAAGRYCLAVWKASSADVPKSVPYRLQFAPEVTAAPELPVATRLHDVQPNPFNPAARIAFDLARPGRVELDVFDLRGRLVRRLLHDELAAGRHERMWDGRDDAGDGAASGSYFVVLRADGLREVRKAVLLK